MGPFKTPEDKLGSREATFMLGGEDLRVVHHVTTVVDDSANVTTRVQADGPVLLRDSSDMLSLLSTGYER